MHGEAGKGDMYRKVNVATFGKNFDFAVKKPGGVCPKCRVKRTKGENHYCLAEGWIRIGGKWVLGGGGKHTIVDNKDFIAKQHGCARHQVAAFNKKYGHTGTKWNFKGEPVFKDANSLTKFRKAFGYPVW